MTIDYSMMLREGTTLLGGIYRIERQIASGGFGNTYEVLDTQRYERYALKEFFMPGICERHEGQTTVNVPIEQNRPLFETQREKFKKEALSLSLLGNAPQPNRHIVKVMKLFEENNTVYYVMEYIDGESLSQRLKRTGKPLTEAETIDIVRQVLDGLAAVHAQKIWHLDLNPANILIERGTGRAVIIDFGASKQLPQTDGNTSIMPSAIAYTQGYAPVEQIEQDYDRIGPWTDLYALGATLYNLLTGLTPPTLSAMFNEQDFHLPADTTWGMQDLVKWLMDPNPTERFQSVEDVQEYLDKDYADTDNTMETIPNDSEAPSFDLSQYFYIAVLGLLALAPFLWPMLKIGLSNSDKKVIAEEKVDEVLIPSETFTVNGVSFKMIRVEGGTFTMGATSEQGSDAKRDERPPHLVTLTSYSIGETEVTQALWKAVIGYNPSRFKGSDRPVESISFEDCQTFLSRLNSLTGRTFRLPTEAEWEYAARGGNKSRRYKYSGSNDIDSVAWYRGNSLSETHNVKAKSANELGIYDMAGNVWEWCQDWYDSYRFSSQSNPRGAQSGSGHVVRGGCFFYDAGVCRVSYRDRCVFTFKSDNLGMRLVLKK